MRASTHTRSLSRFCQLARLRLKFIYCKNVRGTSAWNDFSGSVHFQKEIFVENLFGDMMDAWNINMHCELDTPS